MKKGSTTVIKVLN